MSFAARLAGCPTLVCKLGSALVVDPARAAPRQAWLDGFAEDVARLRAAGHRILIVSSGAIACGRLQLGLAAGRLSLDQKQAAAAVGQIRLSQAWAEAFARQGLAIGQVLVTIEDTERRQRHLNARATLGRLLDLGAVPVINENDTVATTEIRFGDNDRLAARVGQMVSAELVILFSDVDGLYTADPRRDPEARHLAEIQGLTPEILALAGPPLPGYSSGGMVTKLEAARIAMDAGAALVIASGAGARPLQDLLEGRARYSWFHPRLGPRQARKQWIASQVRVSGALVVDAGAEAALARGASLLPAGVIRVEGSFRRGDALAIRAADGRDLGRGLAGYPAEEALRICGRQSEQIEGILGYIRGEALVHRDDLALFASG